MRIITFVKKMLIPGSLTFLTLGLGVDVVLLLSGSDAARLGRAWLAVLVAGYWLLSLPVVAATLIGRLQRQYGTIQAPSEAKGAQVLVVIGNGSVTYAAGDLVVDQLTRRTVFCVFEAARLYRLIEPAWIIVSGGPASPLARARPESELMRDQLVNFEVAPDRILLDSSSRTTREQAANIADIIEQRHLAGLIVVVTTAAHMPRVMKAFRERGLDSVPSVASALRYDEGQTGWRRWYPSTAALRGSETVMYEYLARSYTRRSSTRIMS